MAIAQGRRLDARSMLLGAILGAVAVAGLLIVPACRKAETHTDRKAPAPSHTAGAPGQSAAELDAVLARVDDVTITVGEFQERLNRQSPYIRARYTSLEQKREFLDSLIRFEVLAKEALRRGFDKDPEVVRTMKQVMIQKLMKDEFETKIGPDSVPEADMKAYYDQNVAEYVKPEEVRASAIILKNRAQAQKVATEAAGEAGRTNKGFRDLVTKYSSDETTRIRGGDLRYFTAADVALPAPVVTAAFALIRTGDVSPAIDAGNGTFYVLKQTGRRKAMTKTLDDVKQQIRNKLYREQRIAAQKTFVDTLKAGAKVEILEGNLAKVRVDTSGAGADDGHGHASPAFPTGMDPTPEAPLPGGPAPEGGAGPETAAPP
jgi:peptidyl-prolyl cis-trans isomerase C